MKKQEHKKNRELSNVGETNETSQSSAYISVSNLSKTFKVKEKKGFIKDMLAPSYRSISAVSNISFSINKGEIIGFIGPNGAGKTTTIKMLCGILWPTSGNVVIDGLVPWEQRKKHVAKIGAVFGQRKSFWPELSVKENLQLIAAIYKAPESRIDAVKFDLKLDSFFDQPFRKLSLGQQMKAELAGAIIHQPSILFLDEPTIGMDIVAKSEFMELLKKVNEKAKTTILLTSHDLHEIELLCKRIIIVNQKILYDGLLEKIRPSKVQVTLTKGSSQKSMVIEKSQVKSMLDKDYDDIKIEEIPIEEIIREYYK